MVTFPFRLNKGITDNDDPQALLQSCIGSIGIKLINTTFGVVTAILLSRMLGASGYGIYAFAISTSLTLAMFTQLGLPQLIVRETAMEQYAKEGDVIRGLWQFSNIAVCGISTLLIFLIYFLYIRFSNHIDPIEKDTLFLAGILIPLISLSAIRGAALRGLHHVIVGQLPDSILRPGLFIVFVALTGLFHRPLTATSAMFLYLLSSALGLITSAVLLTRFRPSFIKNSVSSTYRPRRWLTAAIPMALIDGLQILGLNLGVMVLGLLQAPAEVGVYKAAATTATLVAFGMQAITMVASPHFARLHAKKDISELQQLVTSATRMVFLTAAPVAVILIASGEHILSFVFGNEFAQGSSALSILVIGLLINASMGSVVALLNMSGQESQTLRGMTLATVINVILQFLLVPAFGSIGAATGTAISFATWGVFLHRSVRSTLGIESMIR